MLYARPAVAGHCDGVPEIAPGVAGALFTVMEAVLFVSVSAQPTDVIVMVVAPLLARAMVEKVPLTPLNVIEADCPVAVFAPLKL